MRRGRPGLTGSTRRSSRSRSRVLALAAPVRLLGEVAVRQPEDQPVGQGRVPGIGPLLPIEVDDPITRISGCGGQEDDVRPPVVRAPRLGPERPRPARAYRRSQDLQVNPVEVGSLLCHPAVAGVDESARGVEARLVLREAP